MRKIYELTMTRKEFNDICDADEDARPIMDMRNKLMEMIEADGQDPYMYDSKFNDEKEDIIRITAHYNENRAKP